MGYHGKMLIAWSYEGNIMMAIDMMGISWEYCRNTIGILWDFTGGKIPSADLTFYSGFHHHVE